MPGEPFAPVDSHSHHRADPDAMELRSCPLCGHEDSGRGDTRAVLTYNDFQFFSDNDHIGKRAPIRQVQCRRCFAVFMNPAYSSAGFEALFAEAGASYGATPERAEEQRRWLAERNLLGASARLLDVGCGTGRFLAALPPELPCVGVDVDTGSIERACAAARRAGADRQFLCADFERIELTERPTVVTLFHVLEHLPRPVPVLARLRALARPETRLVVEVPVLRRNATRDVCGLLTVQHLTHFSENSLERSIVSAGWRPLEAVSMDGYNGRRVLAAPAPADTPVPEAADEDVALLDDHLAAWRRNLDTLATRVARIGQPERCVLWGGGMHVEYLYQNTPLFSDRPSCRYVIVDSDRKKQGKSWRGVPILPPDDLPALLASEPGAGETPVVVSSYSNQEGIARAALALGVTPDRVVRLYDTVQRY